MKKKDIKVTEIATTTNPDIPVKLPKYGIASPGIVYSSVGRPGKRRGLFDAPEYDLYEIGRVDDVDSYVHQAFKKKVGLFLKEGFDYVGSNKKIVQYIKNRFQQIAIASNISHTELIRRSASQFIRKSNAFLVKVRDEGASGGKVRIDISGKSLLPIAGYFPVPSETMEADFDINGKVNRWRQRMPNGLFKEFAPEDVVHFTFDRKEGLIFGTPILTPVIDDIRALRKIEENIELLIYKHLFPIFQYIVGTEKAPAGLTEDGLREIDIVRQEIQFMPSEGGIVTPERHEIKTIGVESKALRAESYLEHFKRRVFSGLGMSAVDFGEGDTSNKSTSDNMSRALVDDIKDVQDAFESQFNHFIIAELLLESTFADQDIFSDKNRVDLVFREIDLDKQIKMETHAADLFAKNATSWDELREAIARDPIAVPDDPEDQDINKYPEWHRTFWKLFNEPEKYILASKGALYSAATIAAASHRSTSMTKGDVTEQQQLESKAEVNLAVQKEKAKPRPIVRKKDSFLSGEYTSMRELTENELSKEGIMKMDYATQKINMITNRMILALKSNMNAAFFAGIGSVPHELITKVSMVRREIESRAHLLINRLTADITSTLRKKLIDISKPNDRISMIRTIFDTFKYRIDFITETETQRARNLGKIISVVHSGAIKGKLMIADETCISCKQHAENLVHLEFVSLSNIPPHHPNCSCGLQIAEIKGDN